MSRDRYQELRRLAVGGMGEVILARQVAGRDVERLVALKCIRAELSHDPRFQELFRNELRVAARLGHPNIVHVYDFGVEDNECFLALEYVPGRTLAQVLARARRNDKLIPIDAMVALLLDVAKGLHYAHELREPSGGALDIVHRDIAPQNIMVSYEGVGKILDFGIANARNNDGAWDDGSIMGHLNYMSPEQLRQEPLDRRADIYALGQIMWQLTVGDRMNNFADVLEAMNQVRSTSLPSRRELRRSPPGWEGIIRRAIAPERRFRYTTALELQCDIEDVARSAGIGISNLSVVRLMADLFPESAPAGPTPVPRRKLTVLTVDDEEDITTLVRRCLRRNYVVESANGVEEARRKLAESPYDIIISDERMPDGRGAELLTEVANISPETVRIMVTAFPEADLMLEVINHGHIHRFLPKPFNKNDLLEAVDGATRDVRIIGRTGTVDESVDGDSTGDEERVPRSKRATESSDLTVVEVPDIPKELKPAEPSKFDWEQIFDDSQSHLEEGRLLVVLALAETLAEQSLEGLERRLTIAGVIPHWYQRGEATAVFVTSPGSRSTQKVREKIVEALGMNSEEGAHGLALTPLRDISRWREIAMQTEESARQQLREEQLDES